MNNVLHWNLKLLLLLIMIMMMMIIIIIILNRNHVLDVEEGDILDNEIWQLLFFDI